MELVDDYKKEKLTPGVYIRSQKLPIVKPTMQAKVLKVLEEMGIGIVYLLLARDIYF